MAPKAPASHAAPPGHPWPPGHSGSSPSRSGVPGARVVHDSEGEPAFWETNDIRGLDNTLLTLRQKYNDAVKSLSNDALSLLREWPARLKSITSPHYLYEVRGKPVEGNNYVDSMSHQQIPKIAAPTYRSWGELLTFLMKENLPGARIRTPAASIRIAAPAKIRCACSCRMKARRSARTGASIILSQGQKSTRLSTAFDPVTLYGEDPHPRPDIYGKIGNLGGQRADARRHEEAVLRLRPVRTEHVRVDDDQWPRADHPRDVHEHRDRPERRALPARGFRALGCRAGEDRETVRRRQRPTYTGDLPHGHNGLGLSMLGVTGDQLVDSETYAKIKAATLSAVRGTVQAEILKGDQAQNTWASSAPSSPCA